MAGLNSFCELPHRDDMKQFEPARDAHVRERRSVIRESRSSAVLQALMDMQDQIRRLQAEKSSLNKRFNDLTEETAQYKAGLGCEELNGSQSSVVQRLEDLRNRLDRSQLSSSSLSSAQSSPSKRHGATPRHANTIILDDDSTDSDCDTDNSSHSSSSLSVSPLPTTTTSSRDQPTHTSKTSSYGQRSSSMFHHSHGRHYHMKVDHLPFVVGQSTAPSHSLAGNLQSVLAQLKHHHPIICDHVHPCGHRRSHSVQDSSSRSTMSSRAKRSRPHTAPGRHAGIDPDLLGRRQLLRDMRTLTTTLQRNDVCWT